MLKEQAESAFKSLFPDWLKATGKKADGLTFLSFSEYCDWLRAKGYGSILSFTSRRGALDDAEMWFDEIAHQRWRN